jgi:hypothetical protein
MCSCTHHQTFHPAPRACAVRNDSRQVPCMTTAHRGLAEFRSKTQDAKIQQVLHLSEALVQFDMATVCMGVAWEFIDVATIRMWMASKCMRVNMARITQRSRNDHSGKKRHTWSAAHRSFRFGNFLVMAIAWVSSRSWLGCKFLQFSMSGLACRQEGQMIDPHSLGTTRRTPY